MSVLPSNFTDPHVLSGMPPSTPILVGFSGGADSSALLHMLCTYAKKSGTRICAAHVNHGIRGKEADRDEEFCRAAAASLGVELFVLRADVPRLSRESGESIETCARRVRYRFFDELMLAHDIPLLATAHNANDNLETMLFHLVRGSGLSGLCGIPVSRLCEGGALLRPILGMTREEILAYCHAHRLSFVTDSTNTDTDYTRNKIRAELLPALIALNPCAIEHAAQLAQSLNADRLCLESMANLFLEEMRNGYSLEVEKINGSPDAIVNRALISLYREFSKGASLEHAHVDAIKRLCERAIPHSSVTLPNGIEAVIENGWLIFRNRMPSTELPSFQVPLSEGENQISQINCKIIIRTSQNTKNIYKNSILLSLDSATINGMLYARERQASDRILLHGMHKSLKKLLCEKKIPPALRARLPILCDEDGILAVPMIGVRDGAAPRASSPTTIEILFDWA